MLQNLIVCILGFPPIQFNDPMQQHYALQQQQQQQQQQQLLMRNIRCAKCGFFHPEIKVRVSHVIPASYVVYILLFSWI